MTPRTPKQFKEMREEKKTLIMDVALEHFASEGYHSGTISHIARHAGISKGLMYNYFESKEALLESIILRSLNDIYAYFHIDKDGYLSEDEFIFFVRKVCQVVKDKKSIWRLFFQLLMQNEVREQFLKAYLGSGSFLLSENKAQDGNFITEIMKTITEYFVRKKDKKGPDYDPLLELNMFIFSMYGYALTNIYMNPQDEIRNEKIVNRIIELYK
jgi:AcrR family transcriptional regulator